MFHGNRGHKGMALWGTVVESLFLEAKSQRIG